MGRQFLRMCFAGGFTGKILLRVGMLLCCSVFCLAVLCISQEAQARWNLNGGDNHLAKSPNVLKVGTRDSSGRDTSTTGTGSNVIEPTTDVIAGSHNGSSSGVGGDAIGYTVEFGYSGSPRHIDSILGGYSKGGLAANNWG